MKRKLYRQNYNNHYKDIFHFLIFSFKFIKHFYNFTYKLNNFIFITDRNYNSL